MRSKGFSTLRVGIAGAGLMGRWHAKYAARLGAQVVSILDRDLSRANRLSEATVGDPRVHRNIRDMLVGSQPDVVHICTPPGDHFPCAMAVIGAGAHAIIEKPMAATLSETAQLLDAARASGVNLCPVHQFGFQHGVQTAIGALDSLGDLLQIRFTTASAGGEGQPADGLDALVADIIPHPLSVLQRFRPGIDLDTRNWSGVHTGDGELQLIGQADGVAIDIFISMNARPTRCEMDLLFAKGRVHLNFFHGYAVFDTGRVSRAQKIIQPFNHALKELLAAGVNLGRRSIAREPAYPGLSSLIAGFYNAVVDGTPAPVSPADALAVAAAREELSGRLLAGDSGRVIP